MEPQTKPEPRGRVKDGPEKGNVSWERHPRTHTPTCAATMCPYVGMACALFCSEESRPGTRRRASEPVPHGGLWGNDKVWQADGTLGSLPTVLAGGGCCRLVGNDGTSNHALATLSDPVWPCPEGPSWVFLVTPLSRCLHRDSRALAVQHHGRVNARQGRMALYYRLLIQGNGKANPRKYLVMVWQRLWRPCARPTCMLWNRVNNQVGSYSLVAGRGVLGPTLHLSCNHVPSWATCS